LIKIAMCAAMLLLMVAVVSTDAYASYTVANLNVTVGLNKNTSGQVTEVFTVLVSNSSMSQYSTDRIALNLTLSDWQNLVGQTLVQHIINPKSGVYNFKFLPGPISRNGTNNVALILMSYSVNNVTHVNQTSPRTFYYSFNPRVFNFQHGASGQVLSPNTTLTFVMPDGAAIKAVYPLPDAPVSAFTNDYANITRVSWFYGEPLSKFTFSFITIEGLQTEVLTFFETVYDFFGVFTFVIIIAVILLFIVYTYLRVGR